MASEGPLVDRGVPYIYVGCVIPSPLHSSLGPLVCKLPPSWSKSLPDEACPLASIPHLPGCFVHCPIRSHTLPPTFGFLGWALPPLPTPEHLTCPTIFELHPAMLDASLRFLKLDPFAYICTMLQGCFQGLPCLEVNLETRFILTLEHCTVIITLTS